MKVLQSRDLIERNDLGRIITPRKLETGNTIVAPLIGQVACGKSIFAEENIERTFALPTEIFGNNKMVLLHAKGDSMIGAGINDGDLIVATITNFADDGEIVVALINDSATVKELHRKNGYAIPHAENPKYDGIVTKELIIQGVVKHVIHSY